MNKYYIYKATFLAPLGKEEEEFVESGIVFADSYGEAVDNIASTPDGSLLCFNYLEECYDDAEDGCAPLITLTSLSSLVSQLEKMK